MAIEHSITIPGRTELCGNHTDHNNGKILAAAIDKVISARFGISGTEKTTIFLGEDQKSIEIDLSSLIIHPGEKGKPESLVRGIYAYFQEKGYKTGGLEIHLSSTVPIGKGMSSSAAFEILIGRCLSILFNDDSISKLELAQAGRFAENIYYGKPCGLMDQLACAYGGIIFVDFKSPEEPEIKHISTNFSSSGYTLCLVDTGGGHEDLTDEYASIPFEMELVAAYLGKTNCREVSFKDILNNMKSMRKRFGHEMGERPILRVIHYLEENNRVVEAAGALEKNDFTAYLDVINRSGDSSWKYLQNCNIGKNQNTALALALTEYFLGKGVIQHPQGACRIHGGGFAGTIQAYIPTTRLQEYKEYMEHAFGPGVVSEVTIV